MTDKDSIFNQAMGRLASLIEEARAQGDRDVSAAALATAGTDARPSIRMVDTRICGANLVLFADTATGKGQQMQSNPRAALCFHWPVLQFQVIVEGPVALLSEADSDAQWHHLPRAYKLGHWASDQAGAPDAPGTLQENIRAHRQQHEWEWERVPRTPSWRAFELQPDRLEFWPTGWQRLRARERYLKSAEGIWALSRQNP